MVDLTRRRLMASSVAVGLGASVPNAALAQEEEDEDTPKAPYVRGEIERFATTAFGAEVTGPFVTQNGTLIFSLQHPSRENPAPFNRGGIGYVKGFEFDTDGEDDGDNEFDELSIPTTKDEQGRVRAAGGEYELLAQEDDNIGDNEDLGIPVTPDGLRIDEFAGSRYSNMGHDPDMNHFVATNDEGTEGILFTNWEQSPGTVSRMPIRREDDGGWSADLENTSNLANTDAMRELGGTRINCYGDLSPWNTPLSAEEEYAHPRVSLTSTVSDIVEEGTGVGYRGAGQFWNRPNAGETQEAIDELYGDNSWTVQGNWALSGLELHAYYLGAEPVDQDGDENTLTPIGDIYPNPYRLGYIVDFREPESDESTPIKYWVFGRAAWECPDVQSDERTVYLSSDGENKGFYKFVAKEPIPSYEDTGDIEGTLYAAKVTNHEAAAGKPPAEVDLEIEWLELGTASNGEVGSWIAEYDDVTQADYLEHAETNWEEDLEAALEEADRAVAENGNKDYISDEEIVKWADQYESEGPDGVDEELRRVPFIETRAAAKEIGATVEFRKSEGIDSIEGAEPGDYVYLGISEVNDGMSDDVGEIQVDRVDGGLVYRAELEDDYNLSTLEPVIVGPDGSDPAEVADEALLNIDNVYVMDDGRVLCCEDASQYGRSYPNDCLYVYTPEERTKKADVDEGSSEDDESHACEVDDEDE